MRHSAQCVKSFKLIVFVSMKEKRAQISVEKRNKTERIQHL